MSYPPETSRSSHEADGRSDRSGGSGGAAGSGGVYGTTSFSLCGMPKWSTGVATHSAYPDPSTHNERLVSNWRNWSLGFDYLLQDSEGVALFKSYLQYEGCSNLLDFWFACQGFRSKIDPSDNRKISQLIKAIYRTYIRGSNSKPTTPLSNLLSEPQSMMQPRNEPIRLRTETRRMIAERISRKHSLDQTVFDPAQAEVDHFLRTTAYPAFLKSDIYVDFLQSTIEGKHRGLQFGPKSLAPHTDPSLAVFSGLPECAPNFLLSGKALPTLDEDKELKSDEISANMETSGATLSMESYPQAPDFFSTLHCLHCSQYHSQGHQSTCVANVMNMAPHPCYFPPNESFSSGIQASSPFAFECPQALRPCRQPVRQLNLPNPSMFSPRPPFQRPSHEKELRPKRMYGSKIGYPRVPMNYMYTQWVDAIRPPCMGPLTDPRLTGQLPSQPPNPYHISYAPVSTRDSERHSLSSEARTDDTHSHADSGHENITTLFRQCAQSNRRPERNLTPHQHGRRQQSAETGFDRPSAYPPVSEPFRTRDDNQSQRPAGAKPTCSTEPANRTPDAGDLTKTHTKHHRGTSGRGLSGWRGKSVGTSEIPLSAPKTNIRSHNLAEKDPHAFFRLLSEKLQRVLDDQLATDRLEQLMTEVSPNPPRSNNDELSENSPQKSRQQCESIETTTSVAALPSSTSTAIQRSGSLASSLLQRPWADRLLAAARVQHADNAQAILEDHCSRIWAASADRTPTSSGSGSGGANPLLSESGVGGDLGLVSPPHNQTTCAPRNVTGRKKHGRKSTSMTHSSGPSLLSQSERRENEKSVVDSAEQSSSQCRIDSSKLQELTTTAVDLPMDALYRIAICSANASQLQSPSSLPPCCVQSHQATTQHSVYSSSTTTTTSIISTSTPGIVAGSPPNSASSSNSLVIGYYLGDDPVPYRSVWPSTEITLGQFKQLIPKKKGTFRYFFKKFSDEFGSGVVHQEISDDHCILPLWEGKVVAKVERIE